MGHKPGEPILGILHSADASSGVEIPIYKLGSTTAHTLASDEYIEITSIELVTAVGGDCYVVIGDDATRGAGEDVLRGTFAANDGIQKDDVCHAGAVGQKAYVTAPAGVVDVRFNGVIRKGGDATTNKPGWRENDLGQ